jgi:hypothetical protein
MSGVQRTINNSVSLNDIQNEAKMVSTKDPIEALLEIQLNSHNKPGNGPQKHRSNSTNGTNTNNSAGHELNKMYPECLLQNVDIYRLKALIYRDVVRNERTKSKPFVVVVREFFSYFSFFYYHLPI